MLREFDDATLLEVHDPESVLGDERLDGLDQKAKKNVFRFKDMICTVRRGIVIHK